MIPSGISESTSILIGNSIGSAKTAQAILYSKAGICLSIVVSLICTLLVTLFWVKIAHIYTKDEQVSETIEEVIPIYSITIISSYLSDVLGGILWGMGL